MQDQSYFNLKAELEALTPGERHARLESLDSRIAQMGFGNLSAENRFEFAWLLSLGDPHVVESIRSFPQQTKIELGKLYEMGQPTVPRILSRLFLNVAETGRFNQVNRVPFQEGPCIIFLSPSFGRTVGVHARGQRASNPPVGPYYAASLLELFGVRSYVFDLGLGESERKEFEATLKKELPNVWFISIASRFLGSHELDLIFETADLVNKLGAGDLSPRLMAGGIGALFHRERYLRFTPTEIVVCRYGEMSLADMVFNSPYQGPTDHRPSISLFAQVPNLAIAVKNGADTTVFVTPEEECPDDQRRLLAWAFDIAKVPYSTKYWARKLMIDICSCDDLNLMAPETSDEDTDSPPPKLHPANYVFKPNQVKYLSMIGSCPRNCKFCHYRSFDSHRFIIPYSNMIDQLNRVVQVYPDTRQIGWEDDDFLLWKPDLADFLHSLSQNEPTRHLVYYFETLPQYLRTDLLADLKKANFKAILLGLESPIERLLRDMRKLKRHESFESYMATPRLAHDAGFFVRCSTITFYPLITEEELAQTVHRLTDFIDYGIAIELYPYVMALGGADYIETKDHELTYEEYVQPGDSGKIVRLPRIVQPDDPIVRALAPRAVANTAPELEAILAQHQIRGDHPMSFGVLAYFQAIIKGWRALPQRTLDDQSLSDVEQHVNQVIERMVVRHFVQLRTQETIENYRWSGRNGLRLLEADLKQAERLAHVWLALRMTLDFGDDGEIFAAAQLADRLAREGYYDHNVYESLQTRLGYPVQSIRAAAQAAVDALAKLR